MKKILAIILAIFLPTATVMADKSVRDSLMSLTGTIHKFNAEFPQEKVYLQFDNTSYYQGETIWFKAFVVNASMLDRPQSGVLYVDLISPDGVLLKQQKLKIVAGQADGSIALMDGSTSQARDLRGVLPYPGGFYEIRAYTAYMQNFGEEAIFSRVFAVYDKPKEEGNYYETAPVMTRRVTGLDEKRPKTEKLNSINVSFFPEGGHIIIGQPSQIAFKVTDGTGFGIDATGTLDADGQTFSTVHDGMGSFQFTPTGRSNSVEISVGGSTRKFSLPDAEESGCAIHVSESSRDRISVAMCPSADLAGTEIGLSLTCRGEVYEFRSVKLGKKLTTEDIPMEGIPDGVCRVTLFNLAGNIIASRSLYHRSRTAKAPVLTVTPDKDHYGRFEKISLKFNLTDGTGAPLRDRFCVAVRDSRGMGSPFADDLRTSMLLSSDLKGLIEKPGYYFEKDDDEHAIALDLLCQVQGWERYDWRMMAGFDSFREEHRMEKNLTLNGWLRNPSGKKPLENVEVSASVVPADRTLTETFSYVTDSTGYFGFDIGSDFYDLATLTIRAHAPERFIGTDARIIFERSYMPSIRAYRPGETEFFKLSTKVGKVYTPVNSRDDGDDWSAIVNIDDGYLLPDVEIDEQRKYIDYFRFNAFDVTKDVELALDRGEYTNDVVGYLIDKGFDLELEMDTIKAINGFTPFFYVHDNKKFRNTGIFEDPSKIDLADIRGLMVYERPLYKHDAWSLAPLYMEYADNTLMTLVGSPDEFDRVIMVDIQLKEEHELSKRAELMELSKRTTTMTGFSRPYEFYAPEYPTGPIIGDVDYRRTLYWAPNVVTDNSGEASVEFYNSSITQNFNVSAAGITSGGEPYVLDENY